MNGGFVTSWTPQSATFVSQRNQNRKSMDNDTRIKIAATLQRMIYVVFAIFIVLFIIFLF